MFLFYVRVFSHVLVTKRGIERESMKKKKTKEEKRHKRKEMKKTIMNYYLYLGCNDKQIFVVIANTRLLRPA